jgi:hypothetical protein
MVPALAQRLHVSTAAFEHSLATNYPAVAKGLAAWPSIKPGAVELVRRQVASVGDATELNGLDFTPLPWYIMGPGIALLLTGGIASPSAVARSRRGQPRPDDRVRAPDPHECRGQNGGAATADRTEPARESDRGFPIHIELMDRIASDIARGLRRAVNVVLSPSIGRTPQHRAVILDADQHHPTVRIGERHRGSRG